MQAESAIPAWLAVHTEVERELDDVAGIWASGRILAVRGSVATLQYEDGLVEADVPHDELRLKNSTAEPSVSLGRFREEAETSETIKASQGSHCGITANCGSPSESSRQGAESIHADAAGYAGSPPLSCGDTGQGKKYLSISAMVAELKAEAEGLSSKVNSMATSQNEVQDKMDTAWLEWQDAIRERYDPLPTFTSEGLTLHKGRLYSENAQWHGVVLGNLVWQAGVLLANFLAWNFAKSRAGQSGTLKMLELGAGTGVVGLAIAKKLGATVILTDYESDVLTLIQRNIEANALDSLAEARRLDFTDPSTYLECPSFDCIIAADVLLEPDTFVALARTIDAHTPIGRKAEVFIAFQHRGNYPHVFFEALLSLGFLLQRLHKASGDISVTDDPDAMYSDCQFVEADQQCDSIALHSMHIFRAQRSTGSEQIACL